jgi:hypothetical protein
MANFFNCAVHVEVGTRVVRAFVTAKNVEALTAGVTLGTCSGNVIQQFLFAANGDCLSLDSNCTQNS